MTQKDFPAKEKILKTAHLTSVSAAPSGLSILWNTKVGRAELRAYQAGEMAETKAVK